MSVEYLCEIINKCKIDENILNLLAEEQTDNVAKIILQFKDGCQLSIPLQ